MQANVISELADGAVIGLEVCAVIYFIVWVLSKLPYHPLQDRWLAERLDRERLSNLAGVPRQHLAGLWKHGTTGKLPRT